MDKRDNFVVAIDGEAGTGKSTLAKNIAKRCKIIYIDTGAMYRCVTLLCINEKITPEMVEDVEKAIEDISIEFKREEDTTRVLLNGKDVTDDIRTPKVDSLVAKFSALKVVRDKMTPLQREMGKKQSVVMEGRDIGTVVFPNADVKIYLDCSEEERAMRRYKQNIEKGINETYEEVLENIKERHRLETQREIAPLTIAKDAKYIDTTTLSIEEVEEKIIEAIKEKVNV